MPQVTCDLKIPATVVRGVHTPLHTLAVAPPRLPAQPVTNLHTTAIKPASIAHTQPRFRTEGSVSVLHRLCVHVLGVHERCHHHRQMDDDALSVLGPA